MSSFARLPLALAVRPPLIGSRLSSTSRCRLYALHRSMPELDVAAELLPIKEKLDAVIARLNKMRFSGSVRQCTLEPLQNDLREVDELYVDEKFIVDGKIPEGQAILADLLNNAHELYGEVADLAEDDEDDDGKGEENESKRGK